MNNTQIALLLFGFEEDAKPSLEDVNAAFHRLSLKLHPDIDGGSTQAFRAITLLRDQLKIVIASKPKPKPRPQPQTYTYDNNFSNGASNNTKYEDLSIYEKLLAREGDRILSEVKNTHGLFKTVTSVTITLKIKARVFEANVFELKILRNGSKNLTGNSDFNKFVACREMYNLIKNIKIKDKSYLNSIFLGSSGKEIQVSSVARWFI